MLGYNLGLGHTIWMDCYKLCALNLMYANTTNLTNVILVIA